jgi:hypothetical protein
MVFNKYLWSMKMSTLVRKTGLALAISSAALLAPMAANADGTGWMIGGGVYYSTVDDKVEIDWENIERGDFNFDSSSEAFHVTGGYRFNKWLSLDAGYWDLGSFKSDKDGSGSKEQFDAEAWTVGGMVSVPLWIMDFYAKGGAAMWEYDGRNIDTDGTDPYYGIGASFNIGGSLDLYAEWVRFDLETDLDTFGLGVRWTF